MRIIMLNTVPFAGQIYHKNACYNVNDAIATGLIAESHAELAGVRYVTVQWKNGNKQRVAHTSWMKELLKKGAAQICEEAAA